MKIRVDPPAEPVNEWRDGRLDLSVENQGTQDLLGASVSATAPPFMKIDPAQVQLGRIGAGTTRALSFRVSQVGRVEPGSVSPSFSLKAHAAGETVDGVITIAAPVVVSVLGLSDALKLVQIPSFLLLPGALFLMTCELIWRIRKQQGDFLLPFPTPPFWVVAVTLSILAAVLYPKITGWFGSPREYVSAFTFIDVMLVWFASIILAVPAYMITAIGHNRWTAFREAAEEWDRKRRDLNESDEPLAFLRKLIAKDAAPKGQMFPTVSIEKGELRQTVLKTTVMADEECWIVPRASIRSAEVGEKIEWEKIEQALESATDPSGVKTLSEMLRKQPKEIEAAWQRGPIINKPELWPLDQLSELGEDQPLLYRE